MSKSSLFGLIIGLIVLNLISFSIGFLVAATTLAPPQNQAPAWADVAHNISKLQNVARSVGGAYIGDRVLDAQGRVGRLEQRFTRTAPTALQPFAQYIGEQAGYQARRSIGQAPGALREQIMTHAPQQRSTSRSAQPWHSPVPSKQSPSTPKRPAPVRMLPPSSASSLSSPFGSARHPITPHQNIPPSPHPTYRQYS